MDTIVVGVLDPSPGRCTSRMVSVRPAPRSPPVASSVCCSGVRCCRLSDPIEQPRRAGAGGGAFGVVGQRRDPVQRGVHPEAACHHRHYEHEQQCEQHPAPTTFAARLFRPRRRGRPGPGLRHHGSGSARWRGRTLDRSGRGWRPVRPLVRRSVRRSGRLRLRVRGRRRPVVGIAPDHLRRLAATARDRRTSRRRPVVVHSKNVRRPRPTAASSGGPPPTRSRRTRQRR